MTVLTVLSVLTLTLLCVDPYYTNYLRHVSFTALAEWKNSSPLCRGKEECRIPVMVSGAGLLLRRAADNIIVIGGKPRTGCCGVYPTDGERSGK